MYDVCSVCMYKYNYVCYYVCWIDLLVVRSFKIHTLRTNIHTYIIILTYADNFCGCCFSNSSLNVALYFSGEPAVCMYFSMHVCMSIWSTYLNASQGRRSVFPSIQKDQDACSNSLQLPWCLLSGRPESESQHLKS